MFRFGVARSSGVALVLVLMITGVTGLLILGIGLGAKGQVERAKALLDRTNAAFQIRSDEAELAFALLTTDWVRPITDDEASGPVYPRPDWNFRGKEFAFNGAAVSIQDAQGLFLLPQRPDSAEGLAVLFTRFLGMPEARARDGVIRLREEMGQPSWVALQSLHDLQAMNLLTRDEAIRLERVTTLSPTLAFNPASIPDDLLDVWFAGSLKEGLIALRDSGELNSDSYTRVTGSDPVNLSFYPGSRLQVRVTRKSGSVSRTRSGWWLVAPYDVEPLRVTSSRQFSTGG